MRLPLFIHRALLPALLLLAATVPVSALPAEREKGDWIRLQSEHFTFFSNASERSARRVAADLERLRAVFGQLNPDLKKDNGKPTFVYLFRNEPALTPYKPLRNGKRIDMAGYFAAWPEADYIAVNAEMSYDTSKILYHEYTHFLLHANYTHLPIWFDEGLAELYSTFKTNGQFAEIGHADPDHILWLRENNLIPLRELFAMTPASKDYNEGYRRGVFYSESWALVHYLLVGNPERRVQAIQYFSAIARGAQTEDAFRKAFHADEATLEKELRDYVRRSLFNYVRVPVDPAEKLQLKVEPLPWPETLARLGDLAFTLGPENVNDAREHYQAALKIKPDFAPALAGLSRIESAAGHPEAAQAAVAKAAQAAPGDFQVQFSYAQDLLSRGHDPETLQKARAALRRAVEIQPNSGRAWGQLAYTYSFDQTFPAEAITVFETAHRLQPADGPAAYNLVLAYARAGEREKAAQVIEKDMGSAPRKLVQDTWLVWLNEGMNIAELAVRDQKIDEALAILDDLQKRAPAGQAQPAADRAASIRRIRDRNALAARYNEAVALANAQKLPEARAILQEVAANTLDPEIAKSAQDIVAQIDERLKKKAAAKKGGKKG
jgi:tetratricopeptide (TPR) repeat protein